MDAQSPGWQMQAETSSLAALLLHCLGKQSLCLHGAACPITCLEKDAYVELHCQHSSVHAERVGL